MESPPDPYGDLLATCFHKKVDAAEAALKAICLGPGAAKALVHEDSTLQEAWVLADAHKTRYDQRSTVAILAVLQLVLVGLALFVSEAWEGKRVLPQLGLLLLAMMAVVSLARSYQRGRDRWSTVAVQIQMLYWRAIVMAAADHYHDDESCPAEDTQPEPRHSWIRTRVLEYVKKKLTG